MGFSRTKSGWLMGRPGSHTVTPPSRKLERARDLCVPPKSVVEAGPGAQPGPGVVRWAARTLHVHAAPLGIFLATVLGSLPSAPAVSSPPPVRVPVERLLEAMREVKSYSLTATANGARLEADVVLALVHEAATRDPERRPLLLGHREWYEAFLAR